MPLNVNIDREKHIATVTLDFPPMNILSSETEQEINKIFTQLNEEEGIAVVVINSNPESKHFCAGADLGFVWDCDTQEKLDAMNDIIVGYSSAIYNCKWPVITSVYGRAIGAGTVIAACSDIIIAAEGSLFSCPEATIGCLGTSECLSLILPKKLARYYFYTGESVSAEQLKELGAVLDVVPREELEKRTMEVAEKIAGQSPLVLSYVKKIMNHNDDEQLAEKFKFGNQDTLTFNGTEDFKECCAAFKEKRKPVYTGK